MSVSITRALSPCILVSGLLSGCQSHDVRITAGESDTVVINGRGPTVLPVRVVDQRGQLRSVEGLRYSHAAGQSIRVSDDGHVTCVSSGDAQVLVSWHDVAKSLFLRCRPIRALQYVPSIQLLVGGQPEALSVIALRPDGRPVNLVTTKARVHDTTVASLRSGFVYPRARGRTYVDVLLGDCETTVDLVVIERAAQPTNLLADQEFAAVVRLAPGEYRYWRVAPGKYEVTLLLDHEARDSIALESIDATCAAFPDGARHLACVARDRGVIVVRAVTGPGVDRRGTLLIRRLNESTSPAGAHADSEDSRRSKHTCVTVLSTR
jgi:hypothetical protein